MPAAFTMGQLLGFGSEKKKKTQVSSDHGASFTNPLKLGPKATSKEGLHDFEPLVLAGTPSGFTLFALLEFLPATAHVFNSKRGRE